MQKVVLMALTLATVATCNVGIATAQLVTEADIASPRTATSESFLTGPPKEGGPVVVRVSFHLHDINDIDDEAETFEFGGVLTLTWHDERQAFDPAAVGVDEKVYQGAYQFNEVFDGWFPQVVLVNESGLYEKHGVVLRVQSDGAMTLVETVNAAAETDLDMRRYPFDRQRLEAIFEVLGFDKDEVVLRAESGSTGSPKNDDHVVSIPQWSITDISTSTRDRHAPHAGSRGVVSAFVVSIDLRRKSFFTLRLVVFPLIFLVMLSWSVFWMDRSSLGDRISVSFIVILTIVAYQLVVSDLLPRISYATLMNAFLNISFYLMCATVVINLVVSWLDRRGRSEVGDRVDFRCRWIFPVTYFGLVLLAVGTAFQFS